ncbi:MAG TPA: site-specific DNA-methyltransferase [Candidatus Elarobacter sp.]|jgi:DNA modification methylase
MIDRDLKRDAEYQRARTFNGLSAREWTLLSRNVWNDLSSPRQERHLKHGAVYPVKLADRIIRLYSREGDLVLDPFLGVGSSCIASMAARRRSVGIELNPEFARIAVDWIAEQPQDENFMPQVIAGDCMEHVHGVHGVQLTVTSPPYANFIGRSVADRQKTHKTSKLVLDNNSRVRIYSSDPRDLGNLEYDLFLDACEKLLRSLFHATKPGGYAVWVVKDHRLPPERPYVPMHSDLAHRGELAGWKWHDLVVWDQNEQRSLVLLGYPSKFYTNQNSSFLVVLRRPE